MRFAFIADVPGWAHHRQGLGLTRYGATEEHCWSLFFVKPPSFTREALASFDAIRVANVPLLSHLVADGVLPIEGPKLICSLASFQDTARARKTLVTVQDRIDAFAIVDQRLVEHCAGFGKPVLPYIDRTDHTVFYPPRPRPVLSGPLRVGWAGSTRAWGNIKHVDIIEEACARAEVTFVRQDRELDGLKDEAAMRAWYAGLDLYVAANDPETPTPVSQLEAASCGVSLVSTRCGILWPLLERWQVVDRAGSAADLAACLVAAKALGREELHKRGLLFAERFSYFLHWRHDVAEQHTLDVAALVRGAP